MCRRNFAFSLCLLLAAVCALAEGTRTWQQSKFEEFEKGTTKGIAIRSDGALELAPAFNAIATTPSTYIWSIAADAQGDVYVAAGAPARVYRLTPDGKTNVIFEPQELQVQSLVVGAKGVIYAATSPDGKVYKLERRASKAGKPADKTAESSQPSAAAEWTSSVFYEPHTKYIWNLALDSDGRLYVATGDHGEIFRVERDGKGSLFFKSDEAHIRTLAFDARGNLIAGSDGSGLVYRISPQGEAFVVYSAPKKEITALAVDKAGNIYAAGVGEKRTAPASGAMFSGAMLGTTPAAIPPPTPSGAVTISSAPAPAAPLLPALPFPGLGASGSEVYQIAPDGSPRRIWSSREDIVYALGFDSQGRLLAGTGNKGRIFTIRGEQDFTDLVKASANQVTAFAAAPNGGLYVSTSNLGKIFLLSQAPEREGVYQSDVFDARNFSRWGRTEVRGKGRFELWERSGNVDNPDRNWSPWKEVDLQNEVAAAVPPARFVQWKAVLIPGDPLAQINSVLVNYLPKNVAPVIDDVVVQVGARFTPPPHASAAAPETVTISVSPASSPQQSAPVPKFEPPVVAVRDRESIAVRWAARDDNDDQLVYSLYYRGDGETNWKLLKDRIPDKLYSFDAGLLPDGGYTVKVVASDAPSHSPEEALSAERESQRFEVDTTPPRIDDLHAAIDATLLHITFRANDSFSVIKRAEYSIDAGDWEIAEPLGQLSDARAENYDFSVPLPTGASNTANLERSEGPGALGRNGPPGKPAAKSKAKNGDDPVVPASGEHLVVVRVWDRFDNVATAKTVIHTK